MDSAKVVDLTKKRIQSPSSINTYKQCPRRYYYSYIKKLEVLPNIHQIRGKIAHAALEKFYDIDLLPKEDNCEDYQDYFKTSIQRLFLFYWKNHEAELEEVNLSKDQETFYFEETMLMLMNWVNHFLEELSEEISKGIPLEEAFRKITPIREKRYFSENYYVQGFIDAIQHLEEEIRIIDYKTNSNLEITEEQRLQLGIYSLLYQEKHGKKPLKAGIFFLRHKLRLFKVDEELLELAKKEIELIHQNTVSEEIKDYPQKVSPLCRWSSGKCDFFDACQPEISNGRNHMKNNGGQ